jgi:hypothetical protein
MDTKEIKASAIFSTFRIMVVVCIGMMGLLISSCNKSKDKVHLIVRMTDTPGNFNNVMIDLQGVEVTGSGGGTVVLNANPGMYNLLDLSNGITALIATGDLDAGTVSQIRLILGPDNTVMVDSNVYPLSTPSAMQSGLKLQIHRTFEPGISYTILLDFDANQSIVFKGNGEYQLKPVIRTIDVAASGSIRGSITPIGTIATITATSNNIVYSSTANVNGEFLLAGLPAGVYDIAVTPDLPLLPFTLAGVIVSVGIVNNIGIVAL